MAGDIQIYATGVGLVTLASGLLVRRFVPKFPYMIAAMLAGSLFAFFLNYYLSKLLCRLVCDFMQARFVNIQAENKPDASARLYFWFSHSLWVR